MALQAAADELYALPPEQFTAARDDFAARLRKAGERELASAVRELRRPSVSAWLVNTLVRRRSADFDQLMAIGERLRSAMANGAGDDVRRLSEERRGAVTALTKGLAALAGRPVPMTAAEEVRATLEAATADPTAATAVRSGRLVRALRYAGFGELPDLAGAVGLAPAPRPPAGKAASRSGKTRAPSARERQEAERAAQQAAGAADDAQRTYEARLAEQAAAEARVESATIAAEVAAASLRTAEDEVTGARQAAASAAAAAAAARKTAKAAHTAADSARARLAEVRSRATEDGQ